MNIRRMDRNPHGAVRYRATIAASFLKVAESRTIADLLLRGVTAHDWRTELVGKTFSRSETWRQPSGWVNCSVPASN